MGTSGGLILTCRHCSDQEVATRAKRAATLKDEASRIARRIQRGKYSLYRYLKLEELCCGFGHLDFIKLWKSLRVIPTGWLRVQDYGQIMNQRARGTPFLRCPERHPNVRCSPCPPFVKGATMRANDPLNRPTLLFFLLAIFMSSLHMTYANADGWQYVQKRLISVHPLWGLTGGTLSVQPHFKPYNHEALALPPRETEVEAKAETRSLANAQGGLRRVNLVMFNVLHRFFPGMPVQPYFGSGIGWADVGVAGDVNGLTFDITEGQDQNIAYQGIGGVAVNLSKGVHFFADYQYVGTQDLNLLGSLATGSLTRGDEYDNHSAMMGIRVRL